ncbi:MAG TPA: hypothetical protein VFW25_12465 [Silvibacterium sp.]|nr:hypothetical protein [Silvibacterium sp.]
MEADWSVEIGAELPCIDCKWDGFVDLRSSHRTIDYVGEAAQHPALREALLALNKANSAVFTTKCDTWELDENDIDTSEFATTREAARAGFASYIDILKGHPATLISFAFHEQWVRDLTADCRSVDLPHGRVDVVLRSATTNRIHAYGLTLYAAGCGANQAAAYRSWKAILAAAVAATIAAAARTQPAGE